jgi:hypothetical protein
MPIDKYSVLFTGVIDKLNELTGVPKDYVRDVLKGMTILFYQIRKGESLLFPFGKFYWRHSPSAMKTAPLSETGFAESKEKLTLKFKYRKSLVVTKDNALFDYMMEPPRARAIAERWKYRKKRPFQQRKPAKTTNIKIQKGCKKPVIEKINETPGVEYHQSDASESYSSDLSKTNLIKETKKLESSKPVIEEPKKVDLKKNPLLGNNSFRSVLKSFVNILDEEDDEESDGNEEFDD